MFSKQRGGLAPLAAGALLTAALSPLAAVPASAAAAGVGPVDPSNGFPTWFSDGTVKAVSLRLFSPAIACITSSGSQRSSGITAAGLPVRGADANASTWKKGRPLTALSP